MAAPLLHTKLLPPRIHSALVDRPALFARLDEGLAKKLILLSAPTGYGKTTLARMWLARGGLTTAWVSLDENDNDPVRFWTYVLTALRAWQPAAVKAAFAALAAAQPHSIQSILIPLINALAGSDAPCALVLEDYHAIRAAEIHQSVAFLIQNKPDLLHLVLLSRAEPDLPLGILRARDELLELTAFDLRFSASETAAFLDRAYSGELSPAAVAALQERTEGWAAGLRLVARILQEKGGQAAESFSGSHHYVADYLIREVFAAQLPPVQDFLLKTCFLNRLTPALCDAVTAQGDSAAILEQLEREKLFLVALDDARERAWYRYAPFFAESIQSLARQRLGEEGLHSLAEKASAWYAAQRLFDDAIEMALDAELYQRALELVETFEDIYGLKELATFTRWIERIPQALTFQRPQACFMIAQVLLFASDRFAPATAARIEPYLRAAEAAWQDARDETDLGRLLAFRAMMLLWQGELERARGLIEKSLSLLPESDIFWRGVSLLNLAGSELYAGRLPVAQDLILEARALLGASQNTYGMLAATGMLSQIFYIQGSLELSAQLSQQILAEAVGDESMLDDHGEARLRLAEVAYEQNDLAGAQRHAAEALALAERRANELLQAQAVAFLACVETAQGEPALARAELKARAARLSSPQALEELRSAEALLAVRAGETPGAWLLSAPSGLRARKERETLILARWRLRQDQPDEALALLEPALAEAVQHGRLRSRVEILCLQALARRALGDAPRAFQSLGQALSAGQEKGLLRIFLDAGAPLAALLEEFLPLPARPGLRLYVTTLLHLFSPADLPSPAGSPAEQAWIEPLSQQETRVLKLLVAGLSNAEIASELVVSANTVKTHIKNIYRKLDIRSREEARRIVKELRLT